MNEIKKHMVLMGWLFAFALLVSVSGGFLSHQDTAWHQMGQSYEELIPGRTLIYSIFYPLYIIFGTGTWWYSSKNFSSELFDKNFKTAIILSTLSPFMFLPSQDPEVMILSTDLWNIIFRTSYWLMMLVWVSSFLYLNGRLGMSIVKLTNRTLD
ncbi:MAG: hypothetical protein COB26_09575 [Piscirickettsiaceae bacterium]|nr:MAG: hypothetical protein COB89_05875 [Piscirickettsiaceae bacterium]PCI67489.1 MAG: hypothetical protein COB26_09575 [Piscirickettsiaceae bacterium]